MWYWLVIFSLSFISSARAGFVAGPFVSSMLFGLVCLVPVWLGVRTIRAARRHKPASYGEMERSVDGVNDFNDSSGDGVAAYEELKRKALESAK